MRAALELGVIPLVAQGHRNAEAVAAASGCSARGMAVLLGALCQLGLLEAGPDGYALSETSRAFLTPEAAPGYADALLATDVRAFDGLTDAIHTGRPTSDVVAQRTAAIWAGAARADLVGWQETVAAVRERWAALGITAASMPGPRIVDVGCGAALATLALALEDPTASVTCLDRAEVVEVAKEAAAAMGVAHQARFVAGSVTDPASLEGLFDLAYFGDVLHFLDPATIEDVLRATRGHLTSRGRVVLHEVLRSPGDHSEPAPYLAAVWLLCTAPNGRIYTFDEFASLLQGAGFAAPERLGETGWVQARMGDS
ncbi:MAG TPA: methyltransferase [Candidatus Limnocylindrales bacterium]